MTFWIMRHRRCSRQILFIFPKNKRHSTEANLKLPFCEENVSFFRYELPRSTQLLREALRIVPFIINNFLAKKTNRCPALLTRFSILLIDVNTQTKIVGRLLNRLLVSKKTAKTSSAHMPLTANFPLGNFQPVLFRRLSHNKYFPSSYHFPRAFVT